MTETGLVVTGRHLAVSESTRRKNPALFGQPAQQNPANQATERKQATPIRLRQSSKPLMNKLETEFFNRLRALHPCWIIHTQAVTYRIANGLRFTPDIMTFDGHQTTAWEVKGKWFTDDANAKLKMAASVFHEISWRLVWKQDGLWQEQVIVA